MSVVIFAAPSPLVDPQVYTPWSSLQHTWVGWDGSSWDLTDGQSGLALCAGARGLGSAPETDYWLESPGLDGARWNGYIAERREPFWPLEVYHQAGSLEWRQLDRRLWRTFDRTKPGTWLVTNPDDGSTRSLRMRFKDDGDYAPDIDPALIGWQLYGLTFTAEQPYWEGKTIHPRWGKSEDPRWFFGGGLVSAGTSGQAGPPFHISSSVSMTSATVSNDGDVDTGPVWWIHGPCTAATVGLGDQIIEAPVTLTGSQWIRVDTLAQTVLRGSGDLLPVNGARVVPDGLGAVTFAKIPAGQNVPLTITMSGDGYVQMDLTPLYRRAW